MNRMEKIQQNQILKSFKLNWIEFVILIAASVITPSINNYCATDCWHLPLLIKSCLELYLNPVLIIGFFLTHMIGHCNNVHGCDPRDIQNGFAILIIGFVSLFIYNYLIYLFARIVCKLMKAAYQKTRHK
jgi:hypothetical protein